MTKTRSSWIAGTCLIVLAAGGFAAHHETASEAVDNHGKPATNSEKAKTKVKEEKASSEQTTEASESAGSSTQNPCMEDIRKHCSDSFGTGDRSAVMLCLQDNYSNFSEACQQAIQARMQGR